MNSTLQIMNQYNSKWLVCLFIGLFLLYGQTSKAQAVGTPYITGWQVPSCDKNTSGTDFWLTYGEFYNTDENTNFQFLTLELQISTLEDTQVTLTFKGTGETYTYSIPANTVKLINFNNYEGTNVDKRRNVYVGQNYVGLVTNKTLHITSTKPISVYTYGDTYGTSAAASLVIPTSLWDTEYRNLSYTADNYPYILDVYGYELILAKEDNTVITIPANADPTQPQTPTQTKTLNAGDVYATRINKKDLTSRGITANKPVGYIANVGNAYIPLVPRRSAGDVISEWMLPASQWGKTFLIPSIKQGGNTFTSRVRIVSKNSFNSLTYSGANRVGGNGSAVNGGSMDAGEWIELQLRSETGSVYIKTGYPVAVVAYLPGGNLDPGNGDPSMAWVPALNQTVQKVVVAPFIRKKSEAFTHKMLILAKTVDRNATFVNGTALTTGWTEDANSGYSFNFYTFDTTTDFGKSFAVENTLSGMSVSIFGYAGITSYYYSAGSGGCINP